PGPATLMDSAGIGDVADPKARLPGPERVIGLLGEQEVAAGIPFADGAVALGRDHPECCTGPIDVMIIYVVTVTMIDLRQPSGSPRPPGPDQGLAESAGSGRFPTQMAEQHAVKLAEPRNYNADGVVGLQLFDEPGERVRSDDQIGIQHRERGTGDGVPASDID